MSEAEEPQDEYSTQDRSMPRAIVHKKILDAAKEHPDASIETLANKVNGASMELVERVLDKYGDPADATEEGESEDPEGDADKKEQSSEAATIEGQKGYEQSMNTEQSDGATQSNGSSTTEVKSSSQSAADGLNTESEGPGDAESSTEVSEQPSAHATFDDEMGVADDEAGDTTSVPDPEQLTEKQLEVILAIRERPHATQATLAELFDVSRATISQRVNAIEGFEWANRREFVDLFFDDDRPATDGQGRRRSNNEVTTRLDDLTDRIAALEETIDEKAESADSTFDNPELASQVVRACVEYESITEEEEVKIIAELIESGRS